MKKIKIAARSIFIIDGIGAILTSLFMFFLLAPNHDFIGIPKHHLVTFGKIAVVLGFYSFSTFFGFKRPGPLFFYLISFFNLGYLLYTTTILIHQIHLVKIWGWLYFSGEIAILFALIVVEWQTARNVSSSS
jgi:hypothetical protein